MKISIITISFNNKKDIESTILSVINQTYKDIQYIIIDGGSNDGTLEIIEKFNQNIDCFISEPDKGIYDAINKGIKKATGEIVGLIHAGDRLYDNTVLDSVNHHFIVNDIDACYGHSVIVNNKETIVRINKSPKFKKSLFKKGWMPSHQSIYIRREIFEKLGLYRTDFGGSGDYEFVLRYFYFNNIRVRLLDRFMIKFALGGTSTSNYHKLLKTQKTHINCWKANGESPPLSLVPLKLFRKIPQFYKALKLKIIDK